MGGFGLGEYFSAGLLLTPRDIWQYLDFCLVSSHLGGGTEV